jgi:hypothetical protein
MLFASFIYYITAKLSFICKATFSISGCMVIASLSISHSWCVAFPSSSWKGRRFYNDDSNSMATIISILGPNPSTRLDIISCIELPRGFLGFTRGRRLLVSTSSFGQPRNVPRESFGFFRPRGFVLCSDSPHCADRGAPLICCTILEYCG